MNLNFHPDEQGPLTCAGCAGEIDRAALDRCVTASGDDYHALCYELMLKREKESIKPQGSTGLIP